MSPIFTLAPLVFGSYAHLYFTVSKTLKIYDLRLIRWTSSTLLHLLNSGVKWKGVYNIRATKVTILWTTSLPFTLKRERAFQQNGKWHALIYWASFTSAHSRILSHLSNLSTSSICPNHNIAASSFGNQGKLTAVTSMYKISLSYWISLNLIHQITSHPWITERTFSTIRQSKIRRYLPSWGTVTCYILPSTSVVFISYCCSSSSITIIASIKHREK